MEKEHLIQDTPNNFNTPNNMNTFNQSTGSINPHRRITNLPAKKKLTFASRRGSKNILYQETNLAPKIDIEGLICNLGKIFKLPQLLNYQ